MAALCALGVNAHQVLGDKGILLATRDEDALVPVGLNGHLAAALHSTAAALCHAAAPTAGSTSSPPATTVTPPSSTSAAETTT